MQVPGYKVLRWERDWHRPGQPLLDPATFPAVSVATTSTHDIEPLAVWWEMLDDRERAALARRRSASHVRLTWASGRPSATRC